ncbi:amino acid permease [Alicyclobacillus contaminans]|uniref:amino acid permease n=1 Tax=Alicyclobacillus contaminans TaxID=392016 RepID=UPI000400B633|nr:amino acid permease [Alicyclobacillus contaminans]GMA50954.1 amino acid permease [Alicyclobacillus contaminans]
MQSQRNAHATIGLPQAVALYIGAVLGSGVLLVPGLAAEIAGPASLLAWGMMALLVLPMALVMGLLSARFPNAGGVSHFVTRAFGERAGATVGWFFLMSVPIGAPVAAITGAGYLTAALDWGLGARVAIAAVILLIGIVLNTVGMKLAGQVQVAVVAAIIAVLLLAIAGSAPSIHADNFTPFAPHGWVSVGRAAAILFWCFIGWEAVSHLSEEFVNPAREAIRGVTIAAMLVGVLYFLTALAAVGTHSYGSAASSASLVLVIQHLFGRAGAILAGFTAVFICTATVIAYVGAASRLAQALARGGHAPKPLAWTSQRFGTPIGGIGFLTLCFMGVLTLYGAGMVSLTTLIQLPNATFILTYLGGCAAGVRLLRGTFGGAFVSWLSLVMTAVIFPFVGLAALYPLVIAGSLWSVLRWQSRKRRPTAEPLSHP